MVIRVRVLWSALAGSKGSEYPPLAEIVFMPEKFWPLMADQKFTSYGQLLKMVTEPTMLSSLVGAAMAAAARVRIDAAYIVLVSFVGWGCEELKRFFESDDIRLIMSD